MRAASGPRDVAAPLGVLAQLVASGVPTRRATQMIGRADATRRGAGQVLAFGIAVEADVGAGVPAEESAVFRMRAIEAAGIRRQRLRSTRRRWILNTAVPAVRGASPRSEDPRCDDRSPGAQRPAHPHGDGQAARRTAPLDALDVGFTVVQFPDDSTTVAGPSVGWLSSAQWRRLFGQLSAGGVGTVGAATGSVSLIGGVRAPLFRSLAHEGAGELSGVAGSTARSAATASASARVLRIVGPGGGWVRATASMARREAGNLPATGGGAGGVVELDRAGELSASLLEQRAKGQLFTGPLRRQLDRDDSRSLRRGRRRRCASRGTRRSLDLSLGHAARSRRRAPCTSPCQR